MDSKPRYIGIDMSKKTMEIAIVQGEAKPIQHKFTTCKRGIKKLITLIIPGDTIALETGNNSFHLACCLKLDVEDAEVVVLNAGDLHVIFASKKKTDKSDALKLAKLIQRNPIDELPVVPIPTQSEIAMRSSITEQRRVHRQRTQSINALHNLLWNQGIIDVARNDLKKHEQRVKWASQLEKGYQSQAERLLEQIQLLERQLKLIKDDQTQMLKENIDRANIPLSIPGIGIQTALAILAYLGDIKRFSNQHQVSFYAGLVPRVDRSGQQNHLGSITKHGPKHLRTLLIQAAWSSIRSAHGARFHDFYHNVRSRRGSGRAIVAVARKLLELCYQLYRKNELYQEKIGKSDHTLLLKKLKRYGLDTGLPNAAEK